MHLIDTDTLTYLHAGHPRVQERLQVLADPDVAITIITRIEVLRGRFDFVLKATNDSDLLRAQHRAQHLLTRTQELLEQMPVVPITEASAAVFDRLRAARALRK